MTMIEAKICPNPGFIFHSFSRSKIDTGLQNKNYRIKIERSKNETCSFREQLHEQVHVAVRLDKFLADFLLAELQLGDGTLDL